MRIETADLDIQGCNGHVIVQDLQQPTVISVQNSPDVRFARVNMTSSQASGAPATGLTVMSSRLEVVASALYGQRSPDCTAPALTGAAGGQCGASRLHVSRSIIWGGVGSECVQQNYFCGPGGDGLDLQGGADVIVCGRSTDGIDAGFGGVNLFYNDCSHDSFPGIGVSLVAGAQLRWSGVTLHGWDYGTGTNCFMLHSPEIWNLGGTVVQPTLPDPTLTISGNPLPGSSVQFAIDGPPGATVVLSFGRGAIVQVDPNTLIERLTQALRNVNLGAIPASGTATFNWPIAGVLQPGMKLFTQAAVTLSSGEVRRTNSVPVILR